MKLGVVGWSGRPRGVAGEIHQQSGGLVELTACVEPFDDKYEKGCELGVRPRRYRTVAEMVAQEQLDGAVIGSPNHCHLEHLQGFAGLSIPILIEKPLDSTFDKICEVVRFAQGYPGKILVGHCMRYAPILRAAKKMLDRGDIGSICSTRFVQNCHYGNGGYHNWRRRKELSGTWLLEKATHDFDILLWLLEDVPVRVAATQKLQAFGGDKPNDLRCRTCAERTTCPESMQNILYRNGHFAMEELSRVKNDLCVYAREADTPDNDLCLFEFANGVFGTYHQWFFSPRAYHHRVYEIHGTEGAMEINLGEQFGGHILVCPRYGMVHDQQKYDFDYLGRNHYNGDGFMAKHFYLVMRGAEEPFSTVDQAFAAELLGYAGIQAAAEGGFVNPADLLPPDLSRIIDNPLWT
ncbi:MAG: Gfo/Idh/MocA family oxidoreductase [Candidatus Marinimicrobia bacterium]|nr:Gfo/Idh/MocA family oxidoreductase [Candidatus Neomarinimicrobiota bacterium]